MIDPWKLVVILVVVMFGSNLFAAMFTRETTIWTVAMTVYYTAGLIVVGLGFYLWLWV